MPQSGHSRRSFREMMLKLTQASSDRIRRQVNEPERGALDNRPRRLTSRDITDFYEASDARPFKGRTSIARRIQKEHPYRFHALLRQYSWLRRKMKKMGYNPDDARWLLP